MAHSLRFPALSKSSFYVGALFIVTNFFPMKSQAQGEVQVEQSVVGIVDTIRQNIAKRLEVGENFFLGSAKKSNVAKTEEKLLAELMQYVTRDNANHYEKYYNGSEVSYKDKVYIVTIKAEGDPVERKKNGKSKRKQIIEPQVYEVIVETAESGHNYKLSDGKLTLIGELIFSGGTIPQDKFFGITGTALETSAEYQSPTESLHPKTLKAIHRSVFLNAEALTQQPNFRIYLSIKTKNGKPANMYCTVNIDTNAGTYTLTIKGVEKGKKIQTHTGDIAMTSKAPSVVIDIATGNVHTGDINEMNAILYGNCRLIVDKKDLLAVYEKNKFNDLPEKFKFIYMAAIDIEEVVGLKKIDVPKLTNPAKSSENKFITLSTCKTWNKLEDLFQTYASNQMKKTLIEYKTDITLNGEIGKITLKYNHDTENTEVTVNLDNKSLEIALEFDEIKMLFARAALDGKPLSLPEFNFSKLQQQDDEKNNAYLKRLYEINPLSPEEEIGFILNSTETDSTKTKIDGYTAKLVHIEEEIFFEVFDESGKYVGNVEINPEEDGWVYSVASAFEHSDAVIHILNIYPQSDLVNAFKGDIVFPLFITE